MEYNIQKIDLLTEQLDLNSSLLSRLNILEVQTESNNNEINSQKNTISKLNSLIKSLTNDLNYTKQKLHDTENKNNDISLQLDRNQNEFALINYTTDQSLVENENIKEKLINNIEQINNLQDELQNCNIIIKKQKNNFDSIVNELYPEIDVIKELNFTLHAEIEKLKTNNSTAEKEQKSYKDHINDMTNTIEGFTLKYNKESDKKNEIIQELSEKNIVLVISQDENKKNKKIIDELEYQNIEQKTILDTYKIENENIKEELYEINNLYGVLDKKNHIIQSEFENIKNILNEQMIIRDNDKYHYETMLASCAEKLQVETSNVRQNIEYNTNLLIKKANNEIENTNNKKNEIEYKYNEILKENEKLRNMIKNNEITQLEKNEFDKIETEKYQKEIANYINRINSKELDYSIFLVEKNKAVENAQIKLVEKQNDIEMFISKLEEYQIILKKLINNTISLQNNTKNLEDELSIIKLKNKRNNVLLNKSLEILKNEQNAVYEKAIVIFCTFENEVSMANLRAKDEKNKSMYLSSEVTNLQLEIYEIKKDRMKFDTIK